MENRSRAWDMIRQAGKLAGSKMSDREEDNEYIAGKLLQQAATLMASASLADFASEIVLEACNDCGRHIDENGDLDFQHCPGCPQEKDNNPEGKIQRNDGQGNVNYVHTFGPPGHAG